MMIIIMMIVDCHGQLSINKHMPAGVIRGVESNYSYSEAEISGAVFEGSGSNRHGLTSEVLFFVYLDNISNITATILANTRGTI